MIQEFKKIWKSLVIGLLWFLAPLWPSGLDVVKRESLDILADLVEMTEAARTAGIHENR